VIHRPAHGHGLVIGKFYPPHAGHALLVRTAAARCARVTVVVMAASVESIPLERRVAWLREIHAHDSNVTVTGIADDNPVDLESDAVWNAHVELMLEAVAATTRERLDAVFTSEGYGDELGRRLGVRHVAVDPPRATAPVSGTAIRADPVTHWDDLAPCVREYFAWRIVLVGAESTGKTTLAAELAARLAMRDGPWRRCQWVPELGRDVTADKLDRAAEDRGGDAAMADITWATPDFVAIAEGQGEHERRLAASGGPVLICDTDAFATGIWHEHLVGTRSPETERLGSPAPFHLYLLTHPDDVPFVQDGLRDGESARSWMTERFVARLDEDGRRWRWLRGSREDRVTRALAMIDELLAEGWGLADPLG
jgi:NadR type nicotinamide-nucleotide adenylyltransferase